MEVASLLEVKKCLHTEIHWKSTAQQFCTQKSWRFLYFGIFGIFGRARQLSPMHLARRPAQQTQSAARSRWIVTPWRWNAWSTTKPPRAANFKVPRCASAFLFQTFLQEQMQQTPQRLAVLNVFLCFTLELSRKWFNWSKVRESGLHRPFFGYEMYEAPSLECWKWHVQSVQSTSL